jgi:hypothetical protein
MIPVEGNGRDMAESGDPSLNMLPDKVVQWCSFLGHKKRV